MWLRTPSGPWAPVPRTTFAPMSTVTWTSMSTSGTISTSSVTTAKTTAVMMTPSTSLVTSRLWDGTTMLAGPLGRMRVIMLLIPCRKWGTRRSSTTRTPSHNRSFPILTRTACSASVFRLRPSTRTRLSLLSLIRTWTTRPPTRMPSTGSLTSRRSPGPTLVPARRRCSPSRERVSAATTTSRPTSWMSLSLTTRLSTTPAAMWRTITS
mmetsp:Transcript_23362/g.65606  ORF Transcript_23362/g.65606 Transcript_23362/m.65606 type:complete len:209 (+) Transcript_23362:6286-6912(+)